MYSFYLIFICNHLFSGLRIPYIVFLGDVCISYKNKYTKRCISYLWGSRDWKKYLDSPRSADEKSKVVSLECES